MSGWLGMTLRWKGPRRRRGPEMMSRGAPRRYGSDLVGVLVCMRCPLHPLLVWSRSLRSLLVHEIEWFSGSFGPPVYSFKSRQGRALIYRMIFFTDRINLYRVQGTFVPRMPPSASRTKDGQSPLSFLSFPFDMQGIHLHGKSLQHLTFEVFQHVSDFTFDG